MNERIDDRLQRLVVCPFAADGQCHVAAQCSHSVPHARRTGDDDPCGWDDPDRGCPDCRAHNAEAETSLLPCPFCGGTDLKTERVEIIHASRVVCLTCGGQVHTTMDVGEAKHRWNLRANTAI